MLFGVNHDTIRDNYTWSATSAKCRQKHGLYLEWSLFRGVFDTGNEAFISEPLLVDGRCLLFGRVLLGGRTVLHQYRTGTVFNLRVIGTQTIPKIEDGREHSKNRSTISELQCHFSWYTEQKAPKTRPSDFKDKDNRRL